MLIKFIKKWLSPTQTVTMPQSSIPSSNDLPVIDWQLGAKLAGNNQKAAEEMLLLFSKSLPDEFAGIKVAKENQDKNRLLKLLHKLHGATCYCGAPRLKNAIKQYEEALKRNEETETLFNTLEREVSLLLEEINNLK